MGAVDRAALLPPSLAAHSHLPALPHAPDMPTATGQHQALGHRAQGPSASALQELHPWHHTATVRMKHGGPRRCQLLAALHLQPHSLPREAAQQQPPPGAVPGMPLPLSAWESQEPGLGTGICLQRLQGAVWALGTSSAPWSCGRWVQPWQHPCSARGGSVLRACACPRPAERGGAERAEREGKQRRQ